MVVIPAKAGIQVFFELFFRISIIMNFSNHVYVLGAGASAASANTPLGMDLVWNYHLNCGSLVPINNGVSDNSEEDERFANFRMFLELAASIYPEMKDLPSKWANRGSLIFMYHDLAKRHYVDEMLDLLHQRGSIKEIELVRKLIFEHLVESSFDSQNLLYERFKRKVCDVLCKERTAIISFNFDTLLHETYDVNIVFDYLLNFDYNEHPSKHLYEHTNTIKLIKPNGSLDWGICPNCNSVHRYFYFMRKWGYDNKKCFKCQNPVQPYIIIPHERYEGLINDLWLTAKREISAADKVTVIGYSFPEYDNKVIELFANSISYDAKIEVVTYCNDNENKDNVKRDVLMKYNKLFPGMKNGIDVYLDGFEGYLGNS